jgi:SHS2 domain-containing protein
MRKYDQIDISGGAGLKVYGENPEEIFINAAKGLFNLITDTAMISSSEIKAVTLSSDNLDNLFIKWLNELVFLFDTYNFVGKSCSVRLENTGLEGTVSGGFFDPLINESRLLIKAATYHNLSFRKVNTLWEATVIFDI